MLFKPKNPNLKQKFKASFIIGRNDIKNIQGRNTSIPIKGANTTTLNPS